MTGFVRSLGVTGMMQAADGHGLLRYRLELRDWLQLLYLAIAVPLVGFLDLFAFGLVNEVSMPPWLLGAGFFTFHHRFTQYRNRLAVSGTATAIQSLSEGNGSASRPGSKGCRLPPGLVCAAPGTGRWQS